LSLLFSLSSLDEEEAGDINDDDEGNNDADEGNDDNPAKAEIPVPKNRDDSMGMIIVPLLPVKLFQASE